MSVEAISHIMRTHISDGVAKLVAMVLADYADPVTGKCWPKVPTLAAQCSQSERTVQRKIGVLEELDILHVEPNTTGDRKGNMYVLHLPGVPRTGPGRRRRRRDAGDPDTGDSGGSPAELRATGDAQSPVVNAERVPEGHPSGDRAVTRRVTLLSPPMENPPENPSEGNPPNPPSGGKARPSPKLIRGNGVTARPVPILASSASASLDADSAARFDRLWASFPEAGRIDADRRAAERYFAELGPTDQDLAVRLVPNYVAHLRQNAVRGQPARPKALHTWLRTRRFRNLVRPEPEAAAPSTAGRVFVREGTPAWEAWQIHQRASGRIPMPATWSDTARASGWWFPDEMPPAAAA